MTPNTNQPDNTIDGEVDRILEDLWSSAAVDTVNIIQKTKPKNSTYVSDNFWVAKSAIKNLIAQEANKARISELKRLLSVRHRVINSIDLECVQDRIAQLTDKIKQFNDGGE